MKNHFARFGLLSACGIKVSSRYLYRTNTVPGGITCGNCRRTLSFKNRM